MRQTGIFSRTLTWTIIPIFIGACAPTESLVGLHQTAMHEYRIKALSQEKEALLQSDASNHLNAADLYSKAARTCLEAAKEAGLLGNIVESKKEYRMAAHDFIKASDESLSAGDFVQEVNPGAHP
ncbi:MAG: hypothetical protein VST70_07675 [Nitrospirota bacterium]|nr:hypothetical protein [Nitrospirota bacterium]